MRAVDLLHVEGIVWYLIVRRYPGLRSFDRMKHLLCTLNIHFPSYFFAMRQRPLLLFLACVILGLLQIHYIQYYCEHTQIDGPKANQLV